MKKKDKKNLPDRKNYIKLLPAAAVIAAVTVTGVQGKAGISQKVQSENADVKDAEELTGLLTTAYSYDDFSDGTSSSSKAAKSASKRQKKVESKKEQPKRFLMNHRKLLLRDREAHPHRQPLFRQAATKTEPIREAEPDSAVRSLFR